MSSDVVKLLEYHIPTACPLVATYIASDKQMSLEDNVAQLKQLMDGAGTTDKCPMGGFTREKAEHVLKYIMTRYYTYVYV